MNSNCCFDCPLTINVKRNHVDVTLPPRRPSPRRRCVNIKSEPLVYCSKSKIVNLYLVSILLTMHFVCHATLCSQGILLILLFSLFEMDSNWYLHNFCQLNKFMTCDTRHFKRHKLKSNKIGSRVSTKPNGNKEILLFIRATVVVFSLHLSSSLSLSSQLP